MTKITIDELNKYEQYQLFKRKSRIHSIVAIIMMIFLDYVFFTGDIDYSDPIMLCISIAFLGFSVLILWTFKLYFLTVPAAYAGIIEDIQMKKEYHHPDRDGYSSVTRFFVFKIEGRDDYSPHVSNYTYKNGEKLAIGDSVILFDYGFGNRYVFGRSKLC